MTVSTLMLISAILLVYGVSIWGMADALAWFWTDCRATLPHRLDRGIVRAVILAISPLLAAATLVINAKQHAHHARVRRAIRRLPTQADAEQQHLVDEMKHPDFYTAAHHPVGTLGGDQ